MPTDAAEDAQHHAVDPQRMAEGVQEASRMLKALSHSGRLMILCHLAESERSVTELEELMHLEQAAVSQQLARLRLEGLVSARRDGKAIYYSLADARAGALLHTLHELFCAPDRDDPQAADSTS